VGTYKRWPAPLSSSFVAFFERTGSRTRARWLRWAMSAPVIGFSWVGSPMPGASNTGSPRSAGPCRNWSVPFWTLGSFTSELRTGHTVVDVGANIGWFSLLAASIVGPTGKVLAIEADQDGDVIQIADLSEAKAYCAQHQHQHLDLELLPPT
jgi:hypothetical protein